MEKLRIIYIEDSQDDADLARFLLSEKLDRPFELRRVETRDDFLAAAESFNPEVILSDVNLPGYSGYDALQDAVTEYPDIPFILVTGTMSEEVAADFIKSGAWDYVIKERLIRLVTAVKSSLVLKAEKEKQKATQEKLRRSEERLELAMKGSQDGFWDWDILSGQQYFSGRWNEMRGYAPAETIMDRKDWEKLIHPEDLDEVMEALEDHFSGKLDHFQAEFRVKVKSGAYKWMMSRGMAIFDTSGKPCRMSGSHTDISERKETEIRLKTLGRAIYNAPVSVVMTDKIGTIEYVNPKFTQVTGYSPEEAIGKNPSFLQSGEHPQDFYKELWDAILEGEEWNGIFINKKKSGELFYEGASISSIRGRDGEISHFVAIKEDITERVQSEETLIKAIEKAKESERLKSSFLANMSHEIRTPMNGIMGFADLMAKQDLTDEKKMYYADIIKSSSSRLLRLLTDIIDYSKIDAGQIEIHEIPFNLNLLLDEVIQEAKMNLVSTNITEVEVRTQKPLHDDSAVFVSDEIRLKQVLLNLINNAFKFTAEGFVELGYEYSQKKGLVLYVRDTGLGIPEEKQTIIFERFRQVDETTKRSYEGAGLGLSITKGLVEALGGEIWLESEIDEGTSFFVSLPIFIKQEPKEKEPIPIEEDFLNITGLKILIVEDDPVNQQLLEEFFESWEGDVRFAVNGQDGIDLFKNTPDLDLVLMDMKLPDMSGIEVTRKIKKINPDIKVIAQTAYAMSSDRELFKKDGCDGYIEKPYDMIKLFNAIQCVCSG